MKKIAFIIFSVIWTIFWVPASIYTLITSNNTGAVAGLVLGLLPVALFVLVKAVEHSNKKAAERAKTFNQKQEIEVKLQEADFQLNEAHKKVAVIIQQANEEAIISKRNAEEQAKIIIYNARQEAETIKHEAAQQRNAILQDIEDSLNAHLKDTEQLTALKENLEHNINSLKDQYKEQQAQLVNEIENERKVKETKIDYLNEEYRSICTKIESASKELLIAETIICVDDNVKSEEIKSQLAILDMEYKELVKSDSAIVIISEFGYESKRRFNDNKKQILRCFNSESKMIINSVTAANVDKMRGKLTKSFQTINSVFSTDCIAIDKRLLELRLKELELVYFYHSKKEQEQDEQRAIRVQMIEEEKVRREIEKEKIKVEKEETQFKNEVNKLMKYLAQVGDIEKQIYIDKINELEDKIKLLEKDKENILEREQNTRAGFVYIISNIGSFGENIYKIGMTRRLEPMDRIKELGDASVPFEFDVHAIIFSEDAPALETTLHNTFRDNQVNLVNPRKEFYNVSLSEIERVVKENYNTTVTFTQIAKATQYRESQKIKNSIKNEEKINL